MKSVLAWFQVVDVGNYLHVFAALRERDRARYLACRSRMQHRDRFLNFLSMRESGQCAQKHLRNKDRFHVGSVRRFWSK